jgi:hypothetical protein
MGNVSTHPHIAWAESYFHCYVCRGIFAYLILVYRLYVCIILTCSSTIFSDKDTCVCYCTCEGPNHAALLSLLSLMFPYLVIFLVFKTCGLYYSVCPCPSETVRGSNFCYGWFSLLYFTLCDKKGD